MPENKKKQESARLPGTFSSKKLENYADPARCPGWEVVREGEGRGSLLRISSALSDASEALSVHEEGHW